MTQTQAMLCAAGAYFLWASGDAVVKLCAQASLSPALIVGFLGAVGAGGLLAYAFFKRDFSILRPVSLREQIAIAGCSVVVNFANVIALKHLPLTTFYTLVFTSPLIVAALSAVFKHEALSFFKVSCLVAGFLGAAFAIGMDRGGDWIGYASVMTTVLCFSSRTILMRKTSGADSPESIQFVMGVAVTVAGFIGVLTTPQAWPEARTLALLIGMGAFAALGAALYINALHNTVSSNVAQFHYTQIVYGAVFGYLIWHDVPTWNLVAGSVIIIASGIIVAREAHKNGAMEN
jgi:drug/metabolite transporter (DMT)-like permease